jgi:hypothetical protein
MVECTCPTLAAKDDRCTRSTIRCDGRHKRAWDDFEHYGLARGIGSSDGDGLDPNASKEAIKRREDALLPSKDQ